MSNSEVESLLPEFLAEAKDILDKANTSLDLLVGSPDPAEVLDHVCGGVHTVKGSSAMFGFLNTRDRAHRLESELIALKESRAAVSGEDVARIRRDLEAIEALLAARDRVPAAEQEPRQAQPESQPPAQSEDYVRVPLARLNETLSALGEVFLVRNQLVYLMEQFRSEQLDPKDMLQHWERLDAEMRRGIGDLERSAMGMRMTTAQGLFSRMSRVIQSYIADSGKRIEFHFSGESTELDKKVLDALGEPLVHLVRNAMDHGIESPSARTTAGKPAEGRIGISAELIGNEVELRISDDGKGIDAARVLESARRKGIDVSAITDERSAIELIFLPGFSTAETVTDVSGRGVGMDAVRRSVDALGGKISIETEVGAGTTFSIRLPVAMSVVPCLVVDVNGLKYALPNHGILEARDVPAKELRVNAGQGFLSHRGRFVPFVDLRVKLAPPALDHVESARTASFVVFGHPQGPRAARVSRLERNVEIIVKPVPAWAPKCGFATGVAVLPTGEPIFVLSLPALSSGMSDGGLTHDIA